MVLITEIKEQTLKDTAMNNPTRVIWCSLTLFSFSTSPVFTATFTSIRVPLSLAPFDSIPRPDGDDSDVNDDPELYSKATIHDELTLSEIYDLNRGLTSTVSVLISSIFVLRERNISG